MLTNTELNLLKMLSIGFTAQEIGASLKMGIEEFINVYSNLLIKTGSWDDTNLGFWWFQNEHIYVDKLPDNIVSI